MPNFATPETVLRKINGFYYDSDFSNIKLDANRLCELSDQYNKLLIKPSIESGGGSSVLLFERENGSFYSKGQKLDDKFLLNYNCDFIMQKYIEQHPFFKQFNPNASNTLRVFLYRSVKDDRIHVLHNLLRIGAKNTFLDHDHLGGIAIAMDEKGYFNDCAYNITGKAYKSYNGVEFGRLPSCPFIIPINKMAKEIAKNIFYARLLALDFTVNKSGQPLLIEINCWRNGVNQYQMNNGTLFKEFTTEILEYCKTKEPRYIYKL
ncbi:MAG: hypothetical protein K9M80_02925 [Candidatus Marinimicrobia bacterium]|nr:hypothetical protein [Candidatus Neomarinimicrobiota bacterium]